jgi:hypothetical protein
MLLRTHKEQIIEKVCKAPEIKSGAEFDQMKQVEQKVGKGINQDHSIEPTSHWLIAT